MVISQSFTVVAGHLMAFVFRGRRDVFVLVCSLLSLSASISSVASRWAFGRVRTSQPLLLVHFLPRLVCQTQQHHRNKSGIFGTSTVIIRYPGEFAIDTMSSSVDFCLVLLLDACTNYGVIRRGGSLQIQYVHE